MNRTRLFLLPVLMMFLPVLLWSLEPSPSAREDALGGAHPSLADDFPSVFSNPAGIAGLNPVVRYSALDIRMTGTFWKIRNAFAGEDLQAVFPLEDGTYVGLGLQGPIDVGYVGYGRAWRMKAYTSMDVLYPHLAVAADFIFTVGASVTGGWGTIFHLSDTVTMDFGVSGRLFHEQRYLGEADAVEFGALIENIDKLMEMPFEVVPGLGLDTGLITRFRDRWTVSLSVIDLLTVTVVNRFSSTNDLLAGTEPIQRGVDVPVPDISIGGSWHPDLSRVKWFDITGVYLSWGDLLGGLREYPVNYLLGLAAGTELLFWDTLAFRFGFSEGLLTFGLGLSFGGFDLDINCGGEELSNQPGVFSVVDLRLSMSFETRPGRSDIRRWS
jgi:hypothetical protein